MKTGNGMSYDDSDSFRWTDLIIGICFFMGLLGIGLYIAVNFRPLYYLSIDMYDIEAESHLSREVIKENYNALIDYCCPFYFGELNFPSLKSSVSGLSHFAEVKKMFLVFYILGAVGIAGTIFGFISRHKEKVISHFRICAITSVVIPAILLIISLINFNALFILFHKIAFSNQDWIFDPKQDQVIDILPEGFFMLCLIVIALTILIGATVVLVIYIRKRNENKLGGNLMPKKMNFYY